MATHHSSLKNLSAAAVNNSDEDLAGHAVSSSSSYKFDYTSFPTLADPEQDNGETLSKMITNTLRKVTNNASNLVHNYSRMADSSSSTTPIASATPGRSPALLAATHFGGASASTTPAKPVLTPSAASSAVPRERGSSYTHPAQAKEPPLAKTSTKAKGDDLTAPLAVSSFGGGNPVPAVTTTTVAATGTFPFAESEATDARAMVKPAKPANAAPSTASAAPLLLNTDTASPVDHAGSTMAMQSSVSSSDRTVTTVASSGGLRVQSTSQGLRLSNPVLPMLQPTTTNTTAVNEAAPAPATPNSNSNPTPLVSRKQSAPKPELLATALQQRISSIFNNLPNDIELSDDDSASDADTINPSVSISPLRSGANKKSPRHRKYTNSSLITKRSSSGHLSLSLLDNAKSLINSGISNVVNTSSATSIISSSQSSINRRLRKKLKPKRPSENPLKNGGIPRFYWMNDSFVSDCLNCFKPFTAFRRKHHCRFCGQIFCNDCTLFISYTQHKEQRRNERAGIMDKTTSKKNYSDKLRVCKPCFSDVIVYLSDDSSSSSSEEDVAEHQNIERDDQKSLTPVSQSINAEDDAFQHPITRMRSHSVSSRRDSVLENRGFLQSYGKPQGSAVDEVSPSKSRRYPPNSGGSITPEVISKIVPTKGLSMAIPTTRKGESLEIPVPAASYSSVVAPSNSGNEAFTGHSLSATPTNISSTLPNNNNLISGSNNKTWLKNYTYLRNNSNNNESHTSHSFDNLSNMYNKFLRKQSLNNLNSNSDNYNENEENIDGSYKDYSDEGDIESDNEDERVMFMYTSLNHANASLAIGASTSTLSPRTNGPISNNSSAIVVPTLGEFPLMNVEQSLPRQHTISQSQTQQSEPDLILSKLFHNYQSSSNDEKSVVFLEDKPKSSTVRSHERAHASLLRMRSRRKSKSVRNVSLQLQTQPLTTYQQQQQHQQQHLKLLSANNRHSYVDTSMKSSSSPVSSPQSPTPVFNPITGHISMENINFSPHHQTALLLVLMKASSLEELGVTPLITRNSGDFDYHDSLLDDSLYKYHPLGGDQHYELEVNLLEGIGGDDSVIHYDTPYKSNQLIYQEFISRFLQQYLDESGNFEDGEKERWLQIVTKLFKSIDGLKLTDTLDTKQYVKIRRLLGGTIEDSTIVDGIFWTKNIDSKRMLNAIVNPKIALLMFPIEYLKQKEQYITLRIVHSQQDVYITNLVSRLISLEPDVIVVGDTVCGLAERLLEEAKITVISNTKPQVIERISRYTKADIFQSVNDLFFKKGSLGTCKKLEVKKFLYQNLIKSFVFFTGNDVSSGFTIALRGGTSSTLRVVKNAIENTIPTRLNAKLELSLFEDLFLIFKDYQQKSKQIVELLGHLEEIKEMYNNLNRPTICGDDAETTELNEINNVKPEDGAELALLTSVIPTFPIDKEVTEMLNYNQDIERFISRFDNRIIATSPSVKYSLPIPLNNLVESYKLLAHFYHKYRLIQLATSVKDLRDLDADFIKSQFYYINIDLEKLPNKEVDLLKILQYRSSNYLQTLKQKFQSRLRSWNNCMNKISLDPQRRNNIYVLNSTVSLKYSTPCYGPVKVVCDNYTENDMSLGGFLMKIILEAHNICSECGDTYLNHYKTYGHGNGKIDMVLEQIDNTKATSPGTPFLNSQYESQQPEESHNQIFMWSYCTICDSATPVVNMSDDTYNISIGKFFELCFWGTGIIINSHECGHDFFKDHVRYFGCKDLAVKMVYGPIDTYEVIVPKKQLEYLPDIDIKLKIESLEFVKNKSDKFFTSISNRLNRVKIDTIDKIDDGLKKVEEMKSKLIEQIEQIEKMTMEIYNSTLPSVHLPLNSVLRNLQALGVAWDTEFNEFESEYLPSENEITRITQFHLRKFLLDKYSDEEIKGDDDKKESDKEYEIEVECEKPIVESPFKADSDDNNDLCASKSADIPELPPFNDTDHETEPTISRKDTNPTTPIKKADASPGNNLKSSPELRKEIGSMIPYGLLTVNNPLSNVMERIHRMEALLEIERLHNGSSPTKNSLPSNFKSGISKSPIKKLSISHKSSDGSLGSSKDSINPFPLLSAKENRVHHLANFFDQMHFDQISAEFKKQRELELKKKMNSYKAFPIVASKPIVEIYNKIEDAVGMEEKRDISESKRKSDLEKQQTATHFQNNDSTSSGNKSKQGEFADLPQPEKNSLLRSLTNFWADRSATLWDPLDYPLGSSEHTFADSDVIVREDEPSSLIAFCLSSTDYKQKIQNVVDEQSQQNEGGAGVTVISSQINSKKAAQFAKIEKKFKKNNNNPPSELEVIMNKFSTTHLKYQYLDGQTILSCKIFYAEQFEAFRKACGNDDSFIQSLSRCVKWDSSGGKSGSSFLKTLDNRYIIKELSKLELESFVTIAPFYFKYMSQSMFNTLTTAIAKIFGFYQIHIKNPTTGKIFKMDFLIMENLFYNKKTSRIFDLKGSMRNRHVQQTGKENEVLLDENMIEYIYESPVCVREQSKALLTGSLFNDTAFLSAMDVMDYSLVIGIVDEDEVAKDDPTKKLLYVGIIDCIRTFTWDKKVENWVKGTNLIGGKKGKDPTIITPKQYRTRFRAAMEKYILEVPDCWYSF